MKTVTLEELATFIEAAKARDDWEQLAKRDVIVRVNDLEDNLIVGGLTHVALDAGCTDTLALTLDADAAAEPGFEEES